MFFLTWSFLWLRNLLSCIFILFGIITECIYLFIPKFTCLTQLFARTFLLINEWVKQINVTEEESFLIIASKLSLLFSWGYILIQKINLFGKPNRGVKCYSHCPNRQNCVGIVLKPSACNVLFESDRITLISRCPDYFRGPYFSCGSEPFQTLISSKPSHLTRVENCVRIHTFTRSSITTITERS